MSKTFTPMFSVVVRDKILAVEDDCHIFSCEDSIQTELENMHDILDLEDVPNHYARIICIFEITEVRAGGLKKVYKKAVSDFETCKNTRFNIVQDIDRGINISYTMEFFEIEF